MGQILPRRLSPAWGVQVQHSPQQEQKAASSCCELHWEPKLQPARAAGAAGCQDITGMPTKYKPKGTGVQIP